MQAQQAAVLCYLRRAAMRSSLRVLDLNETSCSRALACVFWCSNIKTCTMASLRYLGWAEIGALVAAKQGAVIRKSGD